MFLGEMGGFQLEFVSISRVIILSALIALVENLFFLNPLQDLFSTLDAAISTNKNTRIITGHVIIHTRLIHTNSN